MNKTNFFVSLVLAISILVGQGSVLAAPALQESDLLNGTVQSITLETDSNTGITTIIIEMTGKDQTPQTLRISQETANAIGLVVRDGDGNSIINKQALGRSINIDPAKVIPDQQEDRHPVGNALATFFWDVPGLDYDTIMDTYDEGVSFSVIAQALWLTKGIGGDAKFFQELLAARKNNDYKAFSQFTDDGNAPKNWAQLRKSLLGKKNPGDVTSNKDNGNENNRDKDKSKDNNKDKSKDKGKEKSK